jgi:uncharacterized cupin superfamily protein
VTKPHKMPRPDDLLVRGADRAAADEAPFRHPLNPLSEVRGVMLGRRTGLEKCGVNLLRVAPGKESFVHHVHLIDEEWLYVVSGTGELRIGEERFAVGPGDFAGFPPATLAHHLRNTGTEDLVYLSGGEAVDFAMADFPDLKQRLVGVGSDIRVFPIEAGKKVFGG